MNDTEAQEVIKPKSTFLIYSAVTLTIVIVIFLAYSYISNPGVPSGYVEDFDSVTSAYQQIGLDSAAEASNLAVLNQNIETYQTAGNYTGAAQVIGQNITSISNLTNEVKYLDASITVFDNIADKVTNSVTRNDSLQVVSLWQQGNSNFLTLLNDEDQLLMPTEQYYQTIAAGKSGTPLTAAQENSIVDGINNQSKQMATLGSSLASAYSKLSQDTGLQLQIPTSTSQ